MGALSYNIGIYIAQLLKPQLPLTVELALKSQHSSFFFLALSLNLLNSK